MGLRIREIWTEPGLTDKFSGDEGTKIAKWEDAKGVTNLTRSNDQTWWSFRGHKQEYNVVKSHRRIIVI